MIPPYQHNTPSKILCYPLFIIIISDSRQGIAFGLGCLEDPREVLRGGAQGLGEDRVQDTGRGAGAVESARLGETGEEGQGASQFYGRTF